MGFSPNPIISVRPMRFISPFFLLYLVTPGIRRLVRYRVRHAGATSSPPPPVCRFVSFVLCVKSAPSCPPFPLFLVFEHRRSDLSAVRSAPLGGVHHCGQGIRAPPSTRGPSTFQALSLRLLFSTAFFHTFDFSDSNPHFRPSVFPFFWFSLVTLAAPSRPYVIICGQFLFPFTDPPASFCCFCAGRVIRGSRRRLGGRLSFELFVFVR